MRKLINYLFVIGLILLGWSIFVEPHILTQTIYTLKNEQLKGLKIVYISDIHAAPYHHWFLKHIVKSVNQLKPDIILLGGDFVKGHKEKSSMDMNKIALTLNQLNSPLGIYAVLGNHDGYINSEKMSQALTQNDIMVLSNKNKLIQYKNNTFYIAGIEDMLTGDPDIQKAIPNSNLPIILLSHTPDMFPQVPSTVFLTLSGHTHGGQIKMPFWGAVLIPSIYGTQYAEGLIKENGKNLIVSRGIGTSILPIRFNCFPEIVIIKFE